MPGISLVLVAAFAALAAAAIAAGFVRTRRRRALRSSGLAAALDPLPAGLKHLASGVSDLSDVGLRLPVARNALASRHRLGALLGLR